MCNFDHEKAEVVEFQRLPLEKGVQDESRTHTPNRALPPQSSASTNSATWTKRESERRDSDPRPRPWQGRALPTELLSQSILTPLQGCFRELRCKDTVTF